MPADPDFPTVETDPKASLPACLLCALMAILTTLLGLFATLVMLLANMNLNFTSNIHFPIFLIGWSLVLACARAVWRLARHPSHRSLLTLIPVAILLALLQWLFTRPEARGLMH